MRTAPRSRDAAPGQPPYAHERNSRGGTTTRNGNLTKNLKTEMRFVADPSSGSVVVGPLRFASNVVIPALMESGGSVKIGNVRRRHRKVGDGGEIEVVGAGEGPTALFFDTKGRRRRLTRKTTKAVRDDPLGRRVVYAKIRTTAQARRANELNELLYGTWETKVVQYAPHPYLEPALERVQATGKFDDVLGDVVRGF